MSHSDGTDSKLRIASHATRNLREKRSKTLPGACERCHRCKARCSFEKLQDSCTRCIDLSEPCYPRLRKRMGRRAVAKQLPYGSTSVMQLASNANHVKRIGRHTSLAYFTTGSSFTLHVESQEPHRLLRRPRSMHGLHSPLSVVHPIKHVLETTEGFFQIHRTFMLGPSFVADFQCTVRRLFARSPQLLIDSYSAAMKLMNVRHESSPALESDDLRIAACCLRKLRCDSSSIASMDEAAVIVLLGQALLVYNTLIPAMATQTITRGTLLTVKMWYPDLTKHANFDAVTLTPVLIDTIDCLIRREIPVIQVSDLGRCVVDRFLGVNASLLPLLYELCERSYKAKREGAEYGGTCCADADVYSELERKIRAWSPELPSDFFTKYSAWEVTVMLAQARAYRIAALLVIHRLRFPLGFGNLYAQGYAKDILRELSIMKDWPPDAATGVAFDFPLLVATLELPEQGRLLYKAYEPFRFRRQHSDEILRFIDLVTKARDNGFDGLWFDMVQGHLHGITMT